MITVVINFEIQPKFINDFKSYTLKNAADRSKALGNISVLFYQSDSEKNRFILIETFDSQITIDHYYESDNYHEWHQATAKMIRKIEGNDYTLLNTIAHP